MTESVTQVGGSFLDRVVESFISPELVDFMNTTLYRNNFFIFNYWSIVHFFAGFLYFKLFGGTLKRWIVINIIFEVIEFMLGFSGNPLFVEELIDTVWDIIMGALGYILAMVI